VYYCIRLRSKGGNRCSDEPKVFRVIGITKYFSNFFYLIYNTMTHFSENIASIRAETGLSRVNFARVVGVQATNIQSWEERGHAPRPALLKQVADKLGTTPADLKNTKFTPEEISRMVVIVNNATPDEGKEREIASLREENARLRADVERMAKMNEQAQKIIDLLHNSIPERSANKN